MIPFPHFLLLLCLGDICAYPPAFLKEKFSKRCLMVEFQALWQEVRKMCFAKQSPSDQCGQVLVKPILGRESLSKLMSWEMEHIFAVPCKFSLNYRK